MPLSPLNGLFQPLTSVEVMITPLLLLWTTTIYLLVMFGALKARVEGVLGNHCKYYFLVIHPFSTHLPLLFSLLIDLLVGNFPSPYSVNLLRPYLITNFFIILAGLLGLVVTPFAAKVRSRNVDLWSKIFLAGWILYFPVMLAGWVLMLEAPVISAAIFWVILIYNFLFLLLISIQTYTSGERVIFRGFLLVSITTLTILALIVFLV